MPLTTILLQYIEMFREVASLVFDIGLFLINEDPSNLLSSFEGLLAKEQDKMRLCRL